MSHSKHKANPSPKTNPRRDRLMASRISQSEAADAEQHRRRMEKNLSRRAKELGYELKKIAAPPPEAEATPSPA